jgi:hypothetical protein
MDKPNEWELTDQRIDDLTPNCYGKNITDGREIATEAQKKLLEYLDNNELLKWATNEERLTKLCNTLGVCNEVKNGKR